jgi:hypothetical protein
MTLDMQFTSHLPVRRSTWAYILGRGEQDDDSGVKTPIILVVI